MALSLVSYGDSSESESEESFVSVNKEESRDVRKLLSILPPVKSKGGVVKQPVRIGLPKLETGHDSDSDDETAPSAKRQKSEGGSGLTAILPRPKGDSRAADAPKKAITTKTMVPYTLSKRYQDSKNRTVAKTKAAALRNAKKKNFKEGDSDSDGDEPVSFFSHLDTQSLSSNPDTSDSYPSVQSESNSSSCNISQFSTAVSSHPGTTSVYKVTPSTNLANSAPIAPKPFRITNPNYDPVTGIYAYGDCSYTPPTTVQQVYEEPPKAEPTAAGSACSHPPTHPHQAGGGDWEQYHAQAEQDLASGDVYYEAHQQDHQRQQGPAKPMPGAGPGLSIDDDVFRRLAGGKKRKNWQESLNDIIDIKEADVKEEIKIYQKYHSEEAVNKLYKPDPNLKDPTSQQKRKHQLSFLAHQAKANELQLLKHWGQAAATKKQTQMKYGF